jgi:putative tricarboxylic transport membrane protein
MLVDHQVEIYGLIWALTASCVLASFVGLLLVRPLSRVTLLDSQILVPLVLCVAFAGSYAIDMTIENVVLTAVFGIVGYLMIRFDYPRLTIVIALVLGASAERNFHQSMLMSDGKWGIYLNRPICLLLLAGMIVLLALPIARGLSQQIAARKLSAQRG